MKKDGVKANFIYNLIYNIVNIIVPLVTAPYTARVLGAENIGTVSYTHLMWKRTKNSEILLLTM